MKLAGAVSQIETLAKEKNRLNGGLAEELAAVRSRYRQLLRPVTTQMHELEDVKESTEDAFLQTFATNP